MNSKNILWACVLLCSNLAIAETPGKPVDKPMQHSGAGMHHGMGGMMTDAQREEHLKGMQEHNLQMHDLSNKILAEKDPTKKEQLKKEQLDLMKAHHQKMMEHHQGMKHTDNQ